MKSKVALYLHGFASSPRGAKVTALRGLLAPDLTIEAPDLNVPSFRDLEFDCVVAEAGRAAAAAKPAVVVGSSFGALAALALARRGEPAPLLLIAPALRLGARWTDRLPPGGVFTLFHHGSGREEEIRRSFFDEMLRLNVEDQPPPVPVVVVMGRLDESVPFDSVFETWQRWEESGGLREGSRMIVVEEGDHSLFGSIGLIAEQIRQLALTPSGQRTTDNG